MFCSYDNFEDDVKSFPKKSPKQKYYQVPHHIISIYVIIKILLVQQLSYNLSISCKGVCYMPPFPCLSFSVHCPCHRDTQDHRIPGQDYRTPGFWYGYHHRTIYCNRPIRTMMSIRRSLLKTI